MLLTKQVACPDRHEDIQDAKHKRRPHQPNLGDEPQRKQQRRSQGAQVVERQDLRDQIAERELVLENAQEQRNLQPYQDPSDRDPRIEHHPERIELGKSQEENQGRHPTDEANQDLDLDKACNQIFLDITSQVGA